MYVSRLWPSERLSPLAHLTLTFLPTPLLSALLWLCHSHGQHGLVNNTTLLGYYFEH